MSFEAGMEQASNEAKLGLALSGGGFRASFFHIGVLARLAELRLLHHVEVISTVSGGSIIGALYYLHVKNLLEAKTEEEIKRENYTAYVKIVEDIERDFLKAVQCNLRMMTYCDWKKNLQMAAPDYSRSDRLGELYDEYLYRPVMKPKHGGMVQMRDLYIHPMGPDGKRIAAFNPRRDNAERKAKVPILLINATALNNGHDWRFEASTMGEPTSDDGIHTHIDKNIRLRRPSSYDRMVKRQQDVELGLAVAASACVPGIFHPLAISDLYPDIRVELVDGGVHDNQGVQGLIDAANCCSFLIISDGSGQLHDEDNPATWLGAALNRSQEIFMKRVREEQLRRVLEDWGGRAAFCHLRHGIAPRTARWVTAEGTLAEDAGQGVQSGCASFGVPAEVQRLLSRVRTDLDSFTEVEAYSLMLDGYLVSGHVVSGMEAFKVLAGSPPQEPASRGWEFMKIKPWLEKPTPLYLKHLGAAESQFFKAFKLNTLLALGGLTLAAAFLWWLIFKSPLADARISIGQVLLGALSLGTALLLPQLATTIRFLRFLRNPTQRLAACLGQGIVPVLMAIPVKFHLKYIDPLFVRMGRLKNLAPPKEP